MTAESKPSPQNKSDKTDPSGSATGSASNKKAETKFSPTQHDPRQILMEDFFADTLVVKNTTEASEDAPSKSGASKKTTKGKSDAKKAKASKPKSSASKSTKSKEKTSNSPKSKTNASDDLPEPWVSEETITGLFDKISGVTSSAFKLAKRTTETSYKVGKTLMNSQDQVKVMLAAGESLRDMREVAGLTVAELTEAIQLKDKSLLEAVEGGTAALSFELILRLSALLARNDPIPFILKYSRTYSPEVWKLLNDWGAGRLPLQYQREREFINIFRSSDEARELSDESYERVLEFTRQAFNTALHFLNEEEQRQADLKVEMEDLKSQNTLLSERLDAQKTEITRLKAAAKLLSEQIPVKPKPAPDADEK